MRKLLRKIKNTWNNLSITRRDGIKNKALTAGAIALFMGAVTLGSPVVALALTGMGLVVGVLGAAMVVALTPPGKSKLPSLIQEIKHGKDKTTWKNALGQTIKSTLVQQRDLLIAQRTLNFYSQSQYNRSQDIKSIVDKFKAVADKVTVKEDIENGDGKFHFANQQTMTTVTPL